MGRTFTNLHMRKPASTDPKLGTYCGGSRSPIWNIELRSVAHGQIDRLLADPHPCRRCVSSYQARAATQSFSAAIAAATSTDKIKSAKKPVGGNQPKAVTKSAKSIKPAKAEPTKAAKSVGVAKVKAKTTKPATKVVAKSTPKKIAKSVKSPAKSPAKVVAKKTTKPATPKPAKKVVASKPASKSAPRLTKGGNGSTTKPVPVPASTSSAAVASTPIATDQSTEPASSVQPQQSTL